MRLQHSTNSNKILSFLWSYLSPFRAQIFIILISIGVVSSAILGLGYALKNLIDQGFVMQDITGLNKAFIMLILMVILLSIASYTRSVRVNSICEQLETSIKKDAYQNLIHLSPDYFETNKLSDIISRLTSDLTLLSNSIMLIASYSLRNALMAIGGLGLLLYTSLKLTVCVLVVLPFILLPVIFIGRKTKKLSKENQSNLSICNAHMEESLSFIKVVQAYNREDFEFKKFSNLIKKAQEISQTRIKLRSLLFALVIALVLSSVALVLWIGGQDVLIGKMTPGSLSSFVFYSVLVATSIGSLSEIYSDWQRAAGALERIIEIIQAKSSISNEVVSFSTSLPLDLQIENLSYFYITRPEMKVLKELSFKVQEGKTVALVGPSGAGKTTIFNLLLRFYDPVEGIIKIGGIDIKSISLRSLRSLFAFVSQDPIIFSGTAYENILYGRLDATEEEVIEAAKAAEIFDFFHSLPDGLNSYLGEKGVSLSGGQKQRIAIARAILKDPKILLLDEATSSLDNENEILVQKALSKLSKNRTTLVIAHRISTISNADLIIVLDKGEIVAKGLHSELLSNNELYRKLNNEIKN